MAGGFYREAVKIEEQALDVMLANGLQINQPEKNTIEAWRNLIGDYDIIVGDDKFVSTESYNRVKDMLQEFRSR